MELSLDTDSLLIADDLARLSKTLGCEANLMPAALNGVLHAAFADYLEMLLGTPLPNRAEEVREKRLLYLLRHYVAEGQLLTEVEISAMFQLNESEARRLLRNVRTKFRSEVDARVASTARKLLEGAAKQDDDSFRVQLTSENLLDALRMTVTVNAPQLDQIAKVRGSAALYDIPPDTYTALCDAFGAQAVH